MLGDADVLVVGTVVDEHDLPAARAFFTSSIVTIMSLRRLALKVLGVAFTWPVCSGFFSFSV